MIDTKYIETDLSEDRTALKDFAASSASINEQTIVVEAEQGITEDKDSMPGDEEEKKKSCCFVIDLFIMCF